MRILLLAALTLILSIWLLFENITYRDSYPTPSKNERLSQEIEELRKIFDARGPQEAYKYFKDNYSSLNSHELAHFVGIELYKREGVRGVYICDGSFNWGCYHGFFGQALSTEGRAFLARAKEVCAGNGEKKGTDVSGCIHGIGHGVLALKGYTPQNLIDSLKTCDILGGDAAKSCYNGVFMEHNTATMEFFRSGEIGYRRLGDDPFEPCNKLPRAYRYDCYYEQPSWWVTVLGRDYQKIGNLCLSLKPENREACFRGLGRIVPEAVGNNLQEVEDVCKQMPSIDGIFYCFRDSVQTLLSLGFADATTLCDAVGARGGECREFALDFSCRVLLECD